MSASENAEAMLIVIKRITKWLLIALALALLVVGAALAWVELKQMYEERAQPVNHLVGIRVGDKLSDTLFRNEGFEIDSHGANRNDESRPTYYSNRDSNIYFGVSDDRVVDIVYVCGPKSYGTLIHGIACRSTGDAVLQKYGKNVTVWCLSDKKDKNYTSDRVYDIKKFNVRYYLSSNTVSAFHVGNTPLRNRSECE